MIWLQLTSHHVSDPSVYSLCKLCDVACANCSGPGDAKCLSCAEGYKRDAAVSGRCHEKGEPIKQSSRKVISSSSGSIFAIVVPVFMVFTIITIIVLLYKVNLLLAFCISVSHHRWRRDKTIHSFRSVLKTHFFSSSL